MKKQPTTVPFRGTAEQEQQLLSVIEKYSTRSKSAWRCATAA
jgi:hypothetical protein